MQNDDDGQLPKDPTDDEEPVEPVENEEEQPAREDEPDPTESPSVMGEGSASGSASDPSSDDSVDDMMEEITGNAPTPGKTLAQEMEDAERARRGMPPKEDEGQEEKDEEAA